ncbi:transporter substrate-binding domain-containing protein [Rheinheimera riviphila]|uniref:Transporter substrate-binding domain-containing protein n=1 Tax=Rheinheimera riviphila TaxID=1834037 RepID=A0A437QIK7_9GAMM|nr:transporter substrate-binding domain-containing protein [Rheinheimera riviphila]RVU34382.1 transporter substrate-binding domain-containing protein [Rheinheimera riviphila]
MRCYGWLLGLSFQALATPVPLVTEIFPPYQQLNAQGQLHGWSVDIVQQLFAEAGLGYETQVLPWPRAVKMANEQPGTFIFSLLQTDERLSKYHWVVPLCPMRISFYAAASRTDVAPRNINEAHNFIVGIEQGQANYKYLINHGFRESKNLVVVGQNHQLRQMLALKRVDLILVSENFVEQQNLRHPGQTELRKVFSATELERTLFLAAHLQTDPDNIKRLQQAYRRLFAVTPPRCQTLAGTTD